MADLVNAASSQGKPLPPPRLPGRTGAVCEVRLPASQVFNATRCAWRSDVCLGLASADCAACGGTGRRPGGGLCTCARKAAFRKALWTYRRYRCLQLGCRSRVKRKFGNFERPIENYLLDFDRLAHSFLSPLEYQIFARHLLDNMPWRVAIAGLPVNKGEFWHAVYRIETALGAACISFGLYPLWQYLDLHLPPGEDYQVLPKRMKPEPNKLPKPQQRGKQAVREALRDFASRQRERENRRNAAAVRGRFKAA